ncbi:MAG: rod shape-determining protein MreD [Acidobacteriota bacterium]
MNALRWGGLLAGLGLLQAFLPVVWLPTGAIDWLMIAVTYQALRGTFRRSVVLGAAAGLIQDGLSGGIVGLHGFAKTTVAAVIASLGSFLVVRGPLPEAGVNALASLLESAMVIAWLALLGRSGTVATMSVTARAAATASAAALLLFAARWQRRRQRHLRPRS